MSEEEANVSTPEGTTETTDSPQPQSDPVGETPKQDDHVEGTTEKNEKEELYQTKYQNLVQTKKELEKRVEQWEKVFAQNGMGQQPTVPQQTPELETADDYERMKHDITKTVVDVIQQNRNQDLYSQQLLQVSAELKGAADKYQIPEEVAYKSMEEAGSLLGQGANPAQLMKVSLKLMEAEALRLSHEIKQKEFAADKQAKIKAVENVQHPDPASSPNLTKEKVSISKNILDRAKAAKSGKNDIFG